MEDRTAIGLSPKGRETINRMMEAGVFGDMQDAAKLAMALAITRDETPGLIQDRDQTVWNRGTLDPDGQLRDAIAAFYPEVKTPYRCAEYLIDRGLHLIEEQVRRRGTFEIRDFLE